MASVYGWRLPAVEDGEVELERPQRNFTDQLCTRTRLQPGRSRPMKPEPRRDGITAQQKQIPPRTQALVVMTKRIKGGGAEGPPQNRTLTAAERAHQRQDTR